MYEGGFREFFVPEPCSLPQFCRTPETRRPDIETHHPKILLLLTSSDGGEKNEQAVRVLGPLHSPVTRRTCVVYPPGSRPGLLQQLVLGKTHLGSGFVLRCGQHFSFLDVAIQRWGRPPNWLTSGQAISVLSYWR